LQSEAKPWLNFKGRKFPQMPKKKAREYSRITSIAKARQKKRQDIEETQGAWYFLC
jgi:hypothetical protein